MTLKRRYEVGLEKLLTTESSVSGMKEELIALQPQLKVAAEETEKAMEVISRESAEADKVKQVVSKEEAAASEEAAKVKAIKDECEADLAEALPLLENALKVRLPMGTLRWHTLSAGARHVWVPILTFNPPLHPCLVCAQALDTLTKNDITEVKGMKSPPAGVKLVLEAVCIMKGIKPVRVKDAQSGRMVDDFWEASKGMLMEADFLGSLRAYDKDHIDPNIIKKIKVRGAVECVWRRGGALLAEEGEHRCG